MAYNNNYKNNYNKNNSNNKSQKHPVSIDADFYNPYSFVPLPDVVYQLTESELQELEKIQDAPVNNGFSGKIIIDFEAMSSFCVRCEDEKSMHVNDKYFVPGSSIKGMLRAVMEILSMANARNGVENNRYSMRDLSKNSKYELKSKNNQKSGFLVKLKGNYYIQPCEAEAYKYEKILGWDIFKDKSSAENTLKKGTVQDKYDALKKQYITFDTEDSDEVKSTFLFSGSMSNKKKEYLFDLPDKFDNLIPIQKEQWKEFLFIHEEENENKSWEHWRPLISDYSSPDDIIRDKNPKVAPCFFRATEDGSAVKDLGFSYLYRIPYKKSIHDFFPDAYKVNGVDMCDAIFGYVNQQKKDALKGRVMVSHSFIENPRLCPDKKTFVLSSPKPSFYPFYLDQSNKCDKLNTFFSDTRISGTKRYLIHSKEQASQPGTKNVDTEFYPLEKGTKFTTEVYFHNLHDYELGALLSAITFYKHSECFHSLGYAKPFGFGKMKVCATKIDYFGNHTDEESLYKAFVKKVCNTCHISEDQWLANVSPLFVLSKEVQPGTNIRYPDMKKKEFSAIKNQKYSIMNFSTLCKNKK